MMVSIVPKTLQLTVFASVRLSLSSVIFTVATFALGLKKLSMIID